MISVILTPIGDTYSLILSKYIKDAEGNNVLIDSKIMSVALLEEALKEIENYGKL